MDGDEPQGSGEDGRVSKRQRVSGEGQAEFEDDDDGADLFGGDWGEDDWDDLFDGVIRSDAEGPTGLTTPRPEGGWFSEGDVGG